MAKIFICYSHKDAQWKDLVVSHLRVGRVQDPLSVWSDREILAGDTWQDKIRQAIDEAAIAVFLISSDSLTSEFVNRKEIPDILERCRRGEMRLIPLILKECDWQAIDWLRELQVIPADGKALEGKSQNHINLDLTALAQRIRESRANTFEQNVNRDRWWQNEPAEDQWRPTAQLQTYQNLFPTDAATVQVGTGDRIEMVRRATTELSVADPELANAIRLCAVPRLFDAALLGVLRKQTDDPDGNARLLKKMVGHTFVLPRRGGGYEYERDVRRMLLDEWRADVAKETFDALNREIAHFYWRTYEQWRRSEEQDAGQSHALGIPTAFVTGPASAGGVSVAALPEALHHLTRISTGVACEFFEEHFDQALSEDRFSTCEALLEATRDSLNRMADTSAPEALDRVLLAEARLLRRTQRSSRAEEILSVLLSRDERPLSPPFRREVSRERGDLLSELERAGDAFLEFEKGLNLAEQPDATAMDRAIAHFNVAYPYWTLGQYDRALDEFREAIHLAGSASLGVYARAGSSAVLDDQGRWPEAWDMAVESLHLARTEHRGNASAAGVVARRILSLVGSRSPALIDTMFAEAMALCSPKTARTTLDLRKEHIVALQESGQLARAGQNLRGLSREAGRHPDPRFRTLLLLQTSLMRIDERRLEEGLDICSEVLRWVREGKGASGDQALARINRAITTVERIRAGAVPGDTAAQHWKYVQQDAKEASELFAKLGYRRFAAVARAYLERARAIDVPEGAAEAWDEIRGDLLGAPQYLAHYHIMRADIEAQLGRWTAAREHYRRAAELHDVVDRPGEATQSLQSSAAMAEHEKDYTEATRIRSEIRRRRWELAEVDRYQPSVSAIAADKQNADGILLMSAGDASGSDNLQRARDCFRAACAEATTVSWYYALNLAYVSAALSDWGEASQALKSSLSSGPVWFRVPRFEQLLSEFEGKEVDAIGAQGTLDFREGRLAPAADAFQRSLDKLARLGRDDAREADIRARLAVVHLERNDRGSAIAEINRVLVSDRHTHGTGMDRPFNRICRSMIAGAAQYKRLMAHLTAIGISDSTPAPLRALLVDVRDALVSCLDEIYELEPRTSAEIVPIVTPILLELGAALVPQDTSTERWSLFTVEIPQLHRRIQRDIGIDAPGVRVRGNPNLAPGQYSILIDEVRVVTGETQAGMQYVIPIDERAVAGVTGAVAAVDPVSGKRGFWVPQAEGESSAHGVLSRVEPIPFIVLHLESVIRAHLGELVGLPEIDALVKRWAEQSALTSPKLSEATRLRLTEVIRQLLEEQVPLTEPDEILRVFSADPLGDTSALTRTVRSRLKRLLPGNESWRDRKLLPEASERALSAGLGPDGSAATAYVAPEDVHRTLGEIRRLLRDRHPPPALVIRTAVLRPWLRRLMQPEFPQIPVLAQEELHDARVSVDESAQRTIPGNLALN